MSLTNSAEFLYLRQQLKHMSVNRSVLANNDYDVFVISRFDGNDDTIRPYLSTKYSGHHDPTLYPAVRQQKGKKDTFVQAKDQGGGHAEEKFIRSLNEQGLMFGPPKLIEVYVSRIPCASTSSAWQAHKPFEESNMFWPPGCGPKFKIAMEATPNIKWVLLYEDDYEGNAQVASLACIVEMNKLPNVKAGQWRG